MMHAVFNSYLSVENSKILKFEKKNGVRNTMLNIAIICMLPLYRKNCSMSLSNVVPAQDNEHRDLLDCAPGMAFPV